MPNTPDIDVSALAEALNEKMDRDLDNKAVNVHYIVETWHSGTEWYRVWSDGWIEQGGATLGSGDTVFNLHKAYSDTNYFCVCALSQAGGKPYTGYDWAMTNIAVWSKTTTSFKAVARASTNTSSTLWYACGY